MRALTASDADVDLAAAYAVPPGRQHVRVNFVSSADGAVTVDGKSGALGNDADRELFQLLRSLSDVILVGAGTVRAENYGGATRPIAVVSKSLGLDPAARFFTRTDIRPIIITCESSLRGKRDKRDQLQQLADIIVAGTDDVDLRDALDQLADRGLHRILCEGGPHLFGALMQADLVDELCLTLAPAIAGGDAGRIIAGFAPQHVTQLRLLHVLQDGGHLFLRYSTADD